MVPSIFCKDSIISMDMIDEIQGKLYKTLYKVIILLVNTTSFVSEIHKFCTIFHIVHE